MLTILTPVYNRAYIIEQLYESLIRQTSQKFEWILVDDGSTDNVRELVVKWEKDERRKFYMKYLYQNNGGKHRAWNTGIRHCKGKYTFVVDSDDYLLDDAVKKIERWIRTIRGDEWFAGVSGRKGKCKNNSYSAIGQFPEGKKYVDATNLKRHSNRLIGDMAEVYRTDLLRLYPFPEFEGEKFCTEGAVISRIARDGYKIRWFPDIIYICEYLPDGLMHNQFIDKLNYFKAYTFVVRNAVKYDEFPFNLIEIGKYVSCAKKKGLKRDEIATLINIPIFVYVISVILAAINEKRIYIKYRILSMEKADE